MARRKSGEGCYFEKTIKGYTYKAYKFPDGHTIYAKKAKDLEEKKKTYLAKQTSNSPQLSNLFTFGEYCLVWLKQHFSVITPAVYDCYESVINKRIIPYQIGSIQIKSLTINAFNLYFNELATKYSKGTIDKTWTIIRQVLAYGMEEGVVPQFTITKIHRPNETSVAVKKKEIPFITKEDIDLFCKEVETGKYGDGAYVNMFIMYSGLRISEAVGLKWKYVSADFDEIKIEQTASKIIERDAELNPIIKNGQQVYKRIQKGTKSVEGQRTLPIPPKGQEILKYFYNKYSHRPEDFVFVSSTGNQFGIRAVERTLSRILKNSQCSRKDYTPHCLRHGYGSILIQNGVDIKIVSELLGHSDVSFTYNTYIGTTKSDKTNAVNNVFK